MKDLKILNSQMNEPVSSTETKRHLHPEQPVNNMHHTMS